MVGLVALVFGLWKNYTIAKSSGFIPVPTHLTSVPWLVAGNIFLPLLNLIPEEPRSQWMPYGRPRRSVDDLESLLIVTCLLLLTRIWHSGHRLFAITGTDTLISISPGRNTLFTCDPRLITQLLWDPTFGKPTAMLGLLNLFGPTMAGTVESENILYRRITAPYFNHTTKNHVFQQSVKARSSFIDVVGQASSIDTRLRPMLSNWRFIF